MSDSGDTESEPKRLEDDLDALRASLAARPEEGVDTRKVARELAEIQAHLKAMQAELGPADVEPGAAPRPRGS